MIQQQSLRRSEFQVSPRWLLPTSIPTCGPSDCVENRKVKKHSNTDSISSSGSMMGRRVSTTILTMVVVIVVNIVNATAFTNRAIAVAPYGVTTGRRSTADVVQPSPPPSLSLLRHLVDVSVYHPYSIPNYHRLHRGITFTRAFALSSSTTSSVAVVGTNHTDGIKENTTSTTTIAASESLLTTDHNSIIVDDDSSPPPVVPVVTKSDVLVDNNHHLISPTLPTQQQQQQQQQPPQPQQEFHQFLSHQLNSMQQQNDNSNNNMVSSMEIVRTAMTIEALWKQRYNDITKNRNSVIISDDTHDTRSGGGVVSDSTSTTTTITDPGSDMVSSFNVVLKAWSKACQILLELYEQNIPVTSTNSAATTLSKHGPLSEINIDVGTVQIYTAKDAAIHATVLLLDQCSSSSSSSSNSMKPNRTSFHIVMEAWSKSHDMDSPNQVHQLIQQMEQKYHIRPDTVTYNLYIDTIAYGKIGTTTKYKERIERINKVLHEMESCPTATSNTQTINSVLHAYSTTIGKYVVQLNYHQMDQDQRTVIEEEIESLLSNALRIFTDLKVSYEETKNHYKQPDIISYTTMMECFARHGTIQSTEQVEELFREIKEANNAASSSTQQQQNKRSLRPNVYTYSTVIKAWSRTYHPQAPHRAEELLKECIAMYQDGESHQNRNSGINYNNNHQNKLTSVIFTSVIQCWSRSQEPTKAVKVLQLLQQMRSMAEKEIPTVAPTLLTYNTAIDACTKTRGSPVQQTAALKIAFAIYKTMEISKNIIPNHVTYGTLLKAISSLVPLGDETRNTLSKAVFEKSIKASQVDRNVIQQLQKSCDTNVLQSLLLSSSDPNNRMIQTNNNGHIDFDMVPSQWSKNVRLP